MKLLKENKPVDAWWIYDGNNHGLIMALVVVLTKALIPYHIAAPIAFVITMGVFIYLEHSQERAMMKKDSTRKYGWSQRRWQDVLFPAAYGIVLVGLTW